jgi:hypothetical protein
VSEQGDGAVEGARVSNFRHVNEAAHMYASSGEPAGAGRYFFFFRFQLSSTTIGIKTGS